MSKNEKIIDFEKRGNLVRFYIGTSEDYWGDDWDDAPYEHNAETVYDRFVTRIIDVAFPFDETVLEPANDWRNNGNSGYSKQDMKLRNVPCLIVVPPEIAGWDSDSFSRFVGSDNIIRFFFGDPVEKILTCPKTTILRDTPHTPSEV